ncbi:MAG TPA: hypothetical protein VL334_06620, partial [Anaerolineae bacterium]|nr:hypothetical protein [Anaerolineae bacterium]
MITRDTVTGETPARLATSLIVLMAGYGRRWGDRGRSGNGRAIENRYHDIGFMCYDTGFIAACQVTKRSDFAASVHYG